MEGFRADSIIIFTMFGLQEHLITSGVVMDQLLRVASNTWLYCLIILCYPYNWALHIIATAPEKIQTFD